MSSKNYNIVLFAGKADAKFYENILESFSIEYCLSISKNRAYIPNISAKENVWHHSSEFNDEDLNAITPLDEEIIEKMRSCEARVLRMFDRMEGRGKTVSFQERKRLYLQTLRYCHHILTTKNIDFVLTTDVPHVWMTYTFFSLCKEFNIPFLFPFHTDPFVDAYHIQQDWEDPVPELRERYNVLKAKCTDPTSISLTQPYEEYYRVQTGEEEKKKKGGKKADPNPWYMSFRLRSPFKRWCSLASNIFRNNPLLFLRSAIFFLPRRLRFSFISERVRRYRGSRMAKRMSRFYDAHANAPDFEKRYIYLPLNMQPEATTLPMGGAYVEQILIAEMLDALLPDDVLIYVKEHPLQFEFYPDGKGRSIDFYKDFLACKKVRFVPRSTDTYRLTEHALAIATVTGTAGFEALFREKPVLLFGHRYFQYLEDVFMIRTVEDCREALRKIIEEGFCPDKKNLRIFLKAIEETVHAGTVHVARFDISSFSREENAKNVAKVMIEEIQRVIH